MKIPTFVNRIEAARKVKKAFFVCLILSCIFGCSSRMEQDNGKTVFRYNEAANITSLDPAFARDQANIWAVHQIYNGLVQLGDNLNITPCIAKSWDISADGKEYVFHLRKDVFFHDSPVFPGGKGRRVVAADVSYSFERIMDRKVASPGAWIFNYVEKRGEKLSFKAPDDSTFVLRLKQPFPPFTGILTTVYCSVVPHEALEKYGSDFRRNPVGTGPFRFKLWKEGVKLVLVRNPTYFESEHENRLPYLDAVAITFLADKQSAFLEFVKGNLDFMSGIDPGYKDELLTRDGRLKEKFKRKFRLLAVPYLNTEYLGFLVDVKTDGGRNSPLSLRQVRQAINYSFDRRKMIGFLRNNIGTPGLNGMIPKGMPSFDSAVTWYDYDPRKSRKLLAEAGYPGGRGLAPVVLSTTSDYLDICKYIQYKSGEVGIEIRIDISPPAALKEMKAQAKLPFFRASWIADYPDAENYLSLFYGKNFSPGGPNYTHFHNTGFDLLFEKAMACTNDSIRYGYYRELEKIIMEDSPVVVLYYDQVLRFIQNNIEGLESDPMNMLTLKKVRKR
ncbi:MAG: ABC transporter substrate-binding protein [Bacteroidetes bacterium]|nr:ABC transporter substrate-binding protein [Bacteroidota bacterium]